MRVQVDNVSHLRPADAIAALTSGARALVISGRRTGEETLAAAALAVHALRHGVAVQIENGDPVANVAQQIEIVQQVNARLRAGLESPEAIEPDPYLHGVVVALASLGFDLAHVRAALAPSRTASFSTTPEPEHRRVTGPADPPEHRGVSGVVDPFPRRPGRS